MDTAALEVLDVRLGPPEDRGHAQPRQFAYLPFEHADDRARCGRSCCCSAGRWFFFLQQPPHHLA
jgi:uncharacterized protein (DUF924 family)